MTYRVRVRMVCEGWPGTQSEWWATNSGRGESALMPGSLFEMHGAVGLEWLVIRTWTR